MNRMLSEKQQRRIRLLVRIIFFLSLLFLLDLMIGHCLKSFYYTQKSGWLYRTTYALDSTRADLLIFGASRANHHYVTRQFEQDLKLTSYNTGRDGNAIFYHYAVLRSVMKRYTPKVAILDFSHGEFKKNADSYDRLSSLLPYYDQHPEVRPLIALRGPYEKYKMVSGIYPYNSLLFQIVAGNSEYNKKRERRSDDYGYVPLTRKWNGSLAIDSSLDHYELDTVKINYFRSFVQICADAHIRLYIILSPCYLRFTDKDPSVIIARQVAATYGMPFYDFSSEPVFLSNPAIYADESHLNDWGARIYTKMVINRMQQDTLFQLSRFSREHPYALK